MFQKKPTVKKRKKVSSSEVKAARDNKKANPIAKNADGINDAKPVVESDIAQADTEARLSISGSTYIPADLTSMGLRMDRQLSFNPDLTSTV